MARGPKDTHKDYLDRIRRRQARRDIHPLTCGNNSRHAVLEPHVIPNGKIVLYCPDCDYVQVDWPRTWVDA